MDGFNVSLATFVGLLESWESMLGGTSLSDSCKTCNLQQKNYISMEKSHENTSTIFSKVRDINLSRNVLNFSKIYFL